MERDGALPGVRPIPGAKSGWLYRPSDRMILHRARQDAPPLPIGEVPVVLGRVTYRQADGRHTRIGYQLASDEGPQIATAEQVLDGTWADLLGRDRPASADERHAYARCLAEAVREAPERPSLPVKSRDGGLTLPDADAQRLGYLRTGDPDEGGARAAWRRILHLAAASERTTLALSAMFAGPLVSSLPGVPAHVLNLCGAGQQGKSSTQLVQAALMGDPSPDSGAIFGSMNTTGLALPETLIQARYLPMCREEASSGGLTLPDLEKLFSRIVAGAKRARLGPGGELRPSAGSWHSVFVTSSNESLLRPGQVEALASRLIQLAPPFWPGADAAMEATEAARQFHGWPLVWAQRGALFSAPRIAGWRDLHGEIVGRLTTAEGGIPLTLARILGCWAVGGYMLGEILGMPELGERAVEDAHAELPRILGDVAETHLSPGQVLWEAIAGAIAREPAAWVDPRELTGETRAAIDGIRPRRVLGYLYEGRVHAYVATVKEAAAGAGLDSPVPGLHELRRRGILLTEEARKLTCKHPTRSLRAAVPGRVYVLDVAAAEGAFGDRESPAGVVPDRLPEPPAGGAAEALETSPGGRYSESRPAARSVTDAAQGVWPVPEEAVAYPAWERLAAARGRAGRATQIGVLAADGLYLPNRRPVSVALPASIDEVVPLMEAYSLRTLYLHRSAIEALGLPPYDPAKPGGPQAPVAHPWATPRHGPPIMEMQPEGLSCWMTVTTTGAQRLTVAIPEYDDRMDSTSGRGGLRGAPDGAALLDALMVWVLSTWRGPAGKPKVTPYYLSVNKTAEDLAGGPSREDVVCEAIRRGDVAPVRTPMMVNPQWNRALTAAERGRGWVHQYDKSAAWLAAYGSAKLGVGEPVHAVDGAAYDPSLAGYWRILNVPGTGPEGLPDFRFYPADGGGSWLRSPSVDLLREVYPGWEPDVAEAWYWPTTRRALEGMYRVMHASRERILRQVEEGRPGAHWAKQVNGAIYKSFRGYLARQEPKRDRITGEIYARDVYWRPDWAETLLDLAVANTYRNLRRFVSSGAAVVSLYVDAALIVSDEADPERARPAGMRLGTGGGQWTHEGTVPMSAILSAIDDGAATIRAAFRAAKEG